MILYLDTSVLAAALTHETQTERMLRWLDDQDQERAPPVRDMGVGQFVPYARSIVAAQIGVLCATRRPRRQMPAKMRVTFLPIGAV